MLALLFLILAAPSDAQSVQPGNWDIRSKAVDLTIPGTPGFLLRMARGKAWTEHKCLAPDQANVGIDALFVPKPEAKCRVAQSRIAGGRIEHPMFCPQKQGEPMRIERVGTYGANGFNARLTMTAVTPKGPMRIVADQVGTRTAATCRK